MCPEQSPEACASKKANANPSHLAELDKHARLETSDSFQSWIADCFNWEIDGICNAKWHPDMENAESPYGLESRVGRFSESCRRFSFDRQGIVTAECQTLDGNYYSSAIGLKSIMMGHDGQIFWLDGTARFPACQKSDASFWCLSNEQEMKVTDSNGQVVRFPVLAQCMRTDGETQHICLVLDEKIANDNGRLKLVTPLGLLTIPLFTEYHVSTIAIAMVMGIRSHQPAIERHITETGIPILLRSRILAQRSNSPFPEELDAKAATLVSLLWINFCRTYSVNDLVIYKRVCEAICDQFHHERHPQHELKVLLDHYRKLPSHLKMQAHAYIQAVDSRRQDFLITEAIHILQMGQEMVEEGDEWMPFATAQLCKMFALRYETLSDSPNLDDLQTACALSETFLATYRQEDSLKASALAVFAKCKWEEDLLSKEHKNETIIIEALLKANGLFTGPERIINQQNLYTYLSDQFCSFETFNPADLRRMLDLMSVDQAEFKSHIQELSTLDLVNLRRNKARLLCLAFQGSPEDSSLINQAILHAEENLSACKAAAAEQLLSGEVYVDVLRTYAHVLAIRFKVSEASDDLDKIIAICKEAKAACRPRSKQRADVLHALASHQLVWHERTKSRGLDPDFEGVANSVLLDALRNAKDAHNSALNRTRERFVYANTVVWALLQLFGASLDSCYLDEAIQVATESLATLSHDDGTFTAVLATKCNLLFYRFLHRPSTESYNEAMTTAHEHSRRSPLETIDGPRQVVEMMSLAMRAFSKKVEVLHENVSREDFILVRDQCDQVLHLDRARAIHRVEAGRILGLLLHGFKQAAVAREAIEEAIRLLRKLVTRALSRVDQEWLLKRLSSGLATIACFLVLHAVQATDSSKEEQVLYCLQQLESCRGILAGFVFQSRLNLKLFNSEDKAAADEYHRLVNELVLLEAVMDNDKYQSSDVALDKMMANSIRRRADIVDKMSELENSTLANAGHIGADFLRNLVGNSALVQIVANSDTAVAFLISGTGLQLLPLPELKTTEIVKNLDRLYGKSRLSKALSTKLFKAGQELGSILKWLWDKAVKPILSELGYYPIPKFCRNNRLPRLWWCASGVMSKLPFHAAGKEAVRRKGENVYDYAISSYTTSLMALKMAQDCPTLSEKISDKHMLTVSMPTTPGPDWVPLKAEAELESIKTTAGLNPVLLSNPTKEEVVGALSKHSILHFICHGTSVAKNPSSSALVLGRESSGVQRLTVKELGGINLDKARIAYLAACSTAENSSLELSDESIHLASAFQLAGIPHVIAASWEAKDRAAAPLAGFFYKHVAKLITQLDTFENGHDVVAHALHEALGDLRKDKDNRNPLCWAPFVHVGA